MKNKDPSIWAACRIHRILSQAHVRLKSNATPPLCGLMSELHLLERCWRMFDKAQTCGWEYTTDMLRKRVFSQIASLNGVSRNIHPARTADAPAIADILGEIRHLSDEFGQVEILTKEKRIDVVTDEITLEDIRLGAFCIQLDFERLARRQDVLAFTIVAEDPKPASSDSSVTHPHVRDESLCAGDASVPISRALAEGRISDAFQLINCVLHTYNSGSAYVSLSDWEGHNCADCGELTSQDALYYCDHCSSDFCDACMRSCDRCEQSVCLGCMEENDDGDRLCPTCITLDDKESEEAHEEEQTPISDDPIHDPTEEEPQPSTETIHDSHSNSTETEPPGSKIPGSPPTGDVRTVPVEVSPPQAA